ncbi:hypothetical protein AAFF_G00386750 [Aldrovandia affinis]|uniref:Uncharacterized protein n=1 Tax=Aldrovandia affinis TaxID=143900 RepID=A0AAD7R432_9TELE|nr:hypothetical protein AAFF_G00386750 [Aldrovandia affinis]
MSNRPNSNPGGSLRRSQRNTAATQPQDHAVAGRLQSEQVKQKANSIPESRRPISKASKAQPSSAPVQSRGHSSKRSALSLPVASFVLRDDPDAAGTSDRDKPGPASKREGIRGFKRSSAPEHNPTYSPSPAKKPKAPQPPPSAAAEAKRGPAKSKKRRLAPEQPASSSRVQSRKSGAAGGSPPQKGRRTDSSSSVSSTAGPLPTRAEGRSAKPTKLASNRPPQPKLGAAL